MNRVIRRAWRYFIAAVEGKLEQVADPRIQIEQAIEESKRQHALLTQQAGAVVGNERELDIKLARTLGDIQRLKTSIEHAIRMETKSRSEGDEKKAAHFAAAAEAMAGRLASVEGSAGELNELRIKASVASAAARAAVEQNARTLRQQLIQRSRLLTQLEAAEMQEKLNTALASIGELAPAGDVPTLDQIQLKIDRKTGVTLGVGEIASSSVEGRVLDVETSMIEQQGLRRLEQIRRSIDLENA